MMQVREAVLMGTAIAMAVLILMALVRAIIGPRFTDRIVAVNLINTLVVALIALMSVWLEEDFLVDVALVYALLSFLTVVVLSRLVASLPKKKKKAKSGKLTDRCKNLEKCTHRNDYKPAHPDETAEKGAAHD